MVAGRGGRETAGALPRAAPYLRAEVQLTVEVVVGGSGGGEL